MENTRTLQDIVREAQKALDCSMKELLVRDMVEEAVEEFREKVTETIQMRVAHISVETVEAYLNVKSKLTHIQCIVKDNYGGEVSHDSNQ